MSEHECAAHGPGRCLSFAEVHELLREALAEQRRPKEREDKRCPRCLAPAGGAGIADHHRKCILAGATR